MLPIIDGTIILIMLMGISIFLIWGIPRKIRNMQDEIINETRYFNNALLNRLDNLEKEIKKK